MGSQKSLNIRTMTKLQHSAALIPEQSFPQYTIYKNSLALKAYAGCYSNSLLTRQDRFSKLAYHWLGATRTQELPEASGSLLSNC